MSAFDLADQSGALPPPALLMQVAVSHFSARCVHTIASLGVADHISESPRPVAAIAADAASTRTPCIASCVCWRRKVSSR
jgi:hypothetical protein